MGLESLRRYENEEVLTTSEISLNFGLLSCLQITCNKIASSVADAIQICFLVIHQTFYRAHDKANGWLQDRRQLVTNRLTRTCRQQSYCAVFRKCRSYDTNLPFPEIYIL